jgi:hypothetical protein
VGFEKQPDKRLPMLGVWLIDSPVFIILGLKIIIMLIVHFLNDIEVIDNVLEAFCTLDLTARIDVNDTCATIYIYIYIDTN